MEARLKTTVVLVLVVGFSAPTEAASYRTRNFIVSAATPQLAKKVGDAAEVYRRELAREWLEEELPDWQDNICPVKVELASGASGQTSFIFRHGRPHDWTMVVRGSEQRILDSVLPHEVTHTIFATHFGQPLPRWADEGACTTVEHASEKAKQDSFLIKFLTTNRGIAFNQMFAMRNYPADILPLYSQGYSLVRFLVSLGGKRKFVDYIDQGLKTNNWTAATREHYGIQSLSELQVTWLEWVRKGGQENDALASVPQHARDHLMGQLASLEPRKMRGESIGVRPVSHTEPGSANFDEQESSRSESARGSVQSVHNAVADSQQSWYARQRDRNRTLRAVDDGKVEQSDAADGSTAPDRDDLHRVTRPQPPVRPGQVILEWSRESPGNAARPAPTPIRLLPLSSEAVRSQRTIR